MLSLFADRPPLGKANVVAAYSNKEGHTVEWRGPLKDSCACLFPKCTFLIVRGTSVRTTSIMEQEYSTEDVRARIFKRLWSPGIDSKERM
jgi:hypothetical protein